MSHFNLICEVANASKEEYQVNIDIQSSTSANVRMLLINHFDITQAFGSKFSDIAPGFTQLPSQADGLALDLIHQPIFNIDKMPRDVPFYRPFL